MKPIALAVVALSLVCATSAPAQDAGLVITRAAYRPVRVAPAEHFTGTVRVQLLFGATATTRAAGALVSFEPGARTAWHLHPAGQILIVTAGVGRVQARGGAIEEIRESDVVRIAPGVQHWHGAAPATPMTHIAVVEDPDGQSAVWFESVSDQQYDAPGHTTGASTGAGAQPRPSRAAIGDFAAKLAELTDNVLYGDGWERPELSERDRSLVTVAALIRPRQARRPTRPSHQSGFPGVADAYHPHGERPTSHRRRAA